MRRPRRNGAGSSASLTPIGAGWNGCYGMKDFEIIFREIPWEYRNRDDLLVAYSLGCFEAVRELRKQGHEFVLSGDYRRFLEGVRESEREGEQQHHARTKAKVLKHRAQKKNAVTPRAA